MTLMLVVSAGIGLVVGGVAGHYKLRSPLLGGLLGAALFILIAHFFFRPPETVVAVDSTDEFEQEVMQADVPVLVDFYADWCPPCRRLGPVLEDLADDYGGRMKLVKIDVDKARGLAMRYQVRGIPTVILFKDGELIDDWTGQMPEMVYRAAIDEALE